MNKIIYAFLFLILSLIVLMDPFKLGFGDWDLFYFYSQLGKLSLLKFGQLPLWNPYHCGGMTQIGNGQDMFWTPFNIPLLLLGPVSGFKLQFLLYLISGFAGMYLLARYFTASKEGSILASLVYCLSSLFFAPYASGMPVFLPLLLTPFVCLFLLKALDNSSHLRPSIYAGITVSLIFLGGLHYIAALMLFILAICTVKAILVKKIYPFKVFSFVFLVFLLTSAVKLIPVIEMVSKYPRIITELYSGYSLKVLAKSLFWPQQGFAVFRQWADSEHNFFTGALYNYDENSIYIGIIPLFFFTIGLIKKGKKQILLLIILIIFIWLSFGFNIFPSLYRIIRGIPFFKLMRVAQRFRFYFMIPMVLFIGFGFDEATVYFDKLFKKKNQVLKILASTIIFLVCIDLLRVNNGILRESFEIPIPAIASTDEFKQKCGFRPYDKNGFLNEETFNSSYSDEFINLVHGWGTTESCYEAQPIRIKALCTDNPAYRGEYYLLNGNGKITSQLWSPNKLVLNTILRKYDYAVINQNYDKGWQVRVNGERKEVINQEGLIAVNLEEGAYQLTFNYLPLSFITGFFISLFSFMAFIVYLMIKKSK